MSENKINLCPFCGKSPHYINMIDGEEVLHIIFCKGTKSFNHSVNVDAYKYDEAVRIWNRRAA